MSGCVWENISAYIENTTGEESRKNYGGKLLSEEDLKYKTIYPHYSELDGVTNNYEEYREARTENYGYGDSILETSSKGPYMIKGWNNDVASFPVTFSPFVVRGGCYNNSFNSGIFALSPAVGGYHYAHGFRVVLCSAY